MPWQMKCLKQERRVMSKVLAVLLELKECSGYWSEYAVPIGIHERIDEAIEELLAQPQKNRLIEVYSDLLKSLIENDGAGLKELKAFDLETYNKLKDIFGASDLLAQPEQEPVRYEYQDENGEWKQFEDKKHFIDNQKWGEPTRALYTSPQKRDHVLHENTQYLLDQVSRLTADISALEGVIKLLSKELYKIEGVE